MSRQVVADDMDLLLGVVRRNHVFEKANKLLAGVPLSRLALHLAGLGVHGRIQRERAVAFVLEAVPLGSSG